MLASSIFALMHAANFLYQDVFQTIMQIINAFGLGILLGTIYYKTKNIWSVIFLHAAYDFAIFLGEVGYVKDCTYGTLTNSIALVTMIQIFLLGALWILGSIYVLKKCNFPDVKASRKKNSTIILSRAIIFL